MDGWWEVVDTEIDNVKYKFKLTNNKKFMKRWIDRKLNLEINNKLRDTDIAFITKFTPYIDMDNIVNFHKFKSDYDYSFSKLSKSRKPLVELWLLKEIENVWYASPLLGTQQANPPQELIEMFSEDLQRFNINILYN